MYSICMSDQCSLFPFIDFVVNALSEGLVVVLQDYEVSFLWRSVLFLCFSLKLCRWVALISRRCWKFYSLSYMNYLNYFVLEMVVRSARVKLNFLQL